MDQRKLIRITEIFLIAFVWIVLLIIPILFTEDNQKPLMESVLNQFKTLIPLSVLLLFNRLYFVPRLLFKGRILSFLVAVFGFICLLAVTIFLLENGKTNANPPIELHTTQPDLPPPDVPRPPPPTRQGGADMMMPFKQGKSEPVPAYANFFVLSILLIGFDTGLRGTLRWSKVMQEKSLLEKENVANQLLLLRNQIGPHFFMNTLNNIHALVDINSEEAKSAIIRLSKMMRYLLPETNTLDSSIAREVEFIESYVRLMNLRLSERVKITIDLPGNLPDKPIHPFLFIPLVENAFKYGISYKDNSFISIAMEVGDKRLLFTVKKSKTNGSQSEDYSGVAIDTIRKRLRLLYGNDYQLDIIENDFFSTINLSIPI